MFTVTAMLLALTAEPSAARLSAEELHELVQNDQAVVVDVRGSVPYALGHIEGAVWMPIGLIPHRAGELPHEKMIVTYCTCPNEEVSLAAAAELQKRGFERLGVLVGGYPAWKQAGYPTASTRERAPAEQSAAGGAARGRLAPPASVACDRNELTSYAGPVTHYRRLRGKTVVVIDSESGAKTVTLRHRGSDDPSASFLIGGKPFTNDDWKRIEERKGELRAGLSAIAWVCRDDGGTTIDWRPGTAGGAAE